MPALRGCPEGLWVSGLGLGLCPGGIGSGAGTGPVGHCRALGCSLLVLSTLQGGSWRRRENEAEPPALHGLSPAPLSLLLLSGGGGAVGSTLAAAESSGGAASCQVSPQERALCAGDMSPCRRHPDWKQPLGDSLLLVLPPSPSCLSPVMTGLNHQHPRNVAAPEKMLGELCCARPLSPEALRAPGASAGLPLGPAARSPLGPITGGRVGTGLLALVSPGPGVGGWLAATRGQTCVCSWLAHGLEICSLLLLLGTAGLVQTLEDSDPRPPKSPVISV